MPFKDEKFLDNLNVPFKTSQVFEISENLRLLIKQCKSKIILFSFEKFKNLSYLSTIYNSSS